MAIAKTFGGVTIGDIRDCKTTTAGATPGMQVEYHMPYTREYSGVRGQGVGKTAVGITPGVTEQAYTTTRKFREFYSLAELAEANDGTGLNIGDGVPGVCIANLCSATPFWAGDTVYAKTGMYHQPSLELGDTPNDRLVTVSATFVISEVVVAPAGALAQANVTATADVAQ